MATAMRVFVTQADHDQSKALMIVGTTMAKRISENSLAPDAVQDVVSFFESYATISESKGQIIYFRILLCCSKGKLRLNKFFKNLPWQQDSIQIQVRQNVRQNVRYVLNVFYFSSSAPSGRCVSETCSRKAAS